MSVKQKFNMFEKIFDMIFWNFSTILAIFFPTRIRLAKMKLIRNTDYVYEYLYGRFFKITETKRAGFTPVPHKTFPFPGCMVYKVSWPLVQCTFTTEEIRDVDPDLLYPDPQHLMNSDPDPGQ